MDYNTYKQRYLQAYKKQEQQLNILDKAYSDEQLYQAFKTYNNHNLWYFRAFKPATLAQTNVVYYDYQIKQALEWRLHYYNDPSYAYDLADVKEDCKSNPDWIVSVIKQWYEETGGRSWSEIQQANRNEIGY